jgi:hypothetical protein
MFLMLKRLGPKKVLNIPSIYPLFKPTTFSYILIVYPLFSAYKETL